MSDDQHASEQKRRSARSRVLLSATLEYPGRVLPIVLRNLSENGDLVEATGLVVSDCECRLRRKDLCVEVHIAWIDGTFAGIEFPKSLSPEAMMEHVGRPALRNTVEPVHRRPGFTSGAMSAQERRWIEEMSRK